MGETCRECGDPMLALDARQLVEIFGDMIGEASEVERHVRTPAWYCARCCRVTIQRLAPITCVTLEVTIGDPP